MKEASYGLATTACLPLTKETVELVSPSWKGRRSVLKWNYKKVGERGAIRETIRRK